MTSSQPIDKDRFIEPDRLYKIIEANLQNQEKYEIIVDIDHARLAQKAGSPMPPAHVLLWSDPELETEILKHNPMAAVDLPLRILAFEDSLTGNEAVITNSFDFIMNRHNLTENRDMKERYKIAILKATQGIPSQSIRNFDSTPMLDKGLVTLNSPYDFNRTKTLILDAIKAQNDTIVFGTIDFTERAKKFSVDLQPIYLILFGAPGPGGKAMSSAPILGLDAFCQKILIWKDSTGNVHVTFNDLIILAEYQKVSSGIPLRIINHRVKKTFSEALKK